MSSIKQTLVQTASNATTSVEIATGLTVDGKAGWSITGMRFSLPNLSAGHVATVDCNVFIQVNTETGNQVFVDKDSIFNQCLQFSGIAASTTSLQVFGDGTVVLPLPRVTVQPTIYLTVISNGMAVPLQADIELYYEIVKLSDLEVMRLLQGGA